MGTKFKLKSSYQPMGDQPQAIELLTNGAQLGMDHQVLLGVTGSGKTFSVANVIERVQKPTLVISHNKTLAAQLYQEYKEFFPENAVEYFVSYYDYYQPEAYIPHTDTYIEKDSDINEDIDRLRLSATTSLLTRSDVIVVASVSCIYNLGSPKEYKETIFELKEGMKLRRQDITTRLIQLFYQRSDYEFKRGTFRISGDTIDIFPAYLDIGVRLELTNDKLTSLKLIDPITGKILNQQGFEEKRKGSYYKNWSQDEVRRLFDLIAYGQFTLYPAKHYIANAERRMRAIEQIREDLQQRVADLKMKGKQIEAYRLEQKTNYDLEMIEEIGYSKGIENYSRYFDGRQPGEPPFSLLDFFPEDYLTIIDESHITIPQIRGMYNGDQARKSTLIEYGFRLPSALDNRPLKFEEFLGRTHQTIYTTATPDVWEQKAALQSARKVFEQQTAPKIAKTGIVEQLIRPTGLIDPEIQVRGTKNQIDNLMGEINKRIKIGQRTLVTTLTKRMAEDLAQFLAEQDIQVHYLHADVDTLDRVDILDDLRRGKYDVLVGINLLREGLDLPEVSLVAILDADKEGFLRSQTSLIQTMGRAARHLDGKVIMYADTITGSMQRAIDEVNRRRKIQTEYNESHGITPLSIQKPIRDKMIERTPKDQFKNYQKEKILITEEDATPTNREKVLKNLEREMREAAKNLEFERAAMLRDRLDELNRKSS
jgi:excinuclease ABC subunit B